jgi:hypothetical protein
MRWLPLLLVLVAGCAHQTIRQQNYLKRMAAMKGQPIDNAIASWGPPDRVFQTPSGKTMYTWIEGGNIRYSSAALGGGRFGSAYAESCKTTLTVGDAGTVEGVILDGECGPIPN